MSGPRVTSGKDSKQDYITPDNLIEAVTKRFGPIEFDLAAHKANAKHARYFAPKELTVKVELPGHDKGFADAAAIEATKLFFQGADEQKALNAMKAHGPGKHIITVNNYDKGAYAFDAFSQDWAALSSTLKVHFSAPSRPGLLWLNCEWSDVFPWADRCRQEAERGANITLLTPAAVGSDWFRDCIAGRANVYLLNGRASFDGINVYPKDCMISHFWPGADGTTYLWDWRRTGEILFAWRSIKEIPRAYEPAS